MSVKKQVARVIVLSLYFIFVFLPLYWIILMSFRTPLYWTAGAAIRFEPTVGFTLDNYMAIIFGGMISGVDPIGKPLINSLIIAFLGTLLSVGAGVPAAYCVSRYKTGGYFMSTLVLGFAMFPPIVIIVPFLIIYILTGLFDTHIGMILFYALINLPFSLWLPKSFFDDIPKDVDEAAVLDGCSLFEAFYRIIIPMAKSGIIVTIVFVFLLTWNEFLGATILTQNNAFTLPVYLSKVRTFYAGVLYGVVGAVAGISMIPAFIFVRYLEEHLVRGLTFGAIKGG